MNKSKNTILRDSLSLSLFLALSHTHNMVVFYGNGKQCIAKKTYNFKENKHFIQQVTFAMCDVSTTWKESVRSRLNDVTQLANDVLKFETRKFLANQDEEFRRMLTSRF